MRKGIIIRRLSSIAAGILWAGLLLSGAISASAQNSRNTDYSPDKTLKSNARVNPSTLAMEFSLPLGGFAGRGGSAMPVTFDYSSKVWQFRSVTKPIYGGGTLTELEGLFAERTAAGWTSSLGIPRIDYKYDIYRGNDPGVLYEGQIEDSPLVAAANEYGLFNIKRLHVTLPDGSSHELRASDTPNLCGSTNGSGCSITNYNGTYLSVDGSRMRLEITTGSTVLYMPDGSRYLFASSTSSNAVTYIDRSGNQSTYDGTNKRWRDTMGRPLQDPLPVNEGNQQAQTVSDQTVSLPGFNGGTMNSTFSWRYLKDPTTGASVLTDQYQALGYLSDKYCTTGSNPNPDITGTHLFENKGDMGLKVCNYGTSAPGPQFNPVVLAQITLPNGQSYQFKYNIYGEIEKIIYPTGAYEHFAYGTVPPTQATSKVSYNQANRGVTDRWVSAKGDGTDEMHWNYTVTGAYTVKTTAPDGSSTEQMIYAETDPDVQRPYGFDNAKTGRPYEDRVYSSGSPAQLLRRHLTAYTMTEALTGQYPSYNSTLVTRDLRPSKEITVIFEPGSGDALVQMSETVYEVPGQNGAPSGADYFAALNAKQTKTYHYVALSAVTAKDATFDNLAYLFSGATPATITEISYLYDADYKVRNITGLPIETRIKDASGTVKAKTQISYDESGYALSSSGSMPTDAANSWVDLTQSGQLGATIGSKHGLPTTVRSYSDVANNQYVETHSFYDQYGNVRKSRDAKGSDTEIQYGAWDAFAYPTKTITPPNGASVSFETIVAYDYNTGLPTSTTDANGLETRMEYNDALLRLTKVSTYSANQPVGSQTITEYGAGTSASTRYVKVKTQIDESKWKEGYSWFDGLGRTTKTQSVDAANGDVFALTCYDQYGRVGKASNPFRNVSNATCSSSLEWMTTTYDAAGRAWKMTAPDNAVVETNYTLATTGNNIGTVVTVKDQALKERRSITNALGQLIRVDEPTDTGGLGAINNPNQATYYSYDLLNNLVTVNQGTAQANRTFAYDSLSKLKSATNPESGTISYTYDANGNLQTKRDARGIKIVYDYDNLNRVINRCYRAIGTSAPLGMTTCAGNTETAEANTPDVSYTYDNPNIANAKGKLTKVLSSVSTTEYQAFDAMGRVTQSQQTTDGTTYTAQTYTYNLSGALIEEKYPSGRVVKNVLDNNGALSIVQSKKNSNSGYWNYADSFTYTAAGAVSSMQLGNGKWESTVLNSRLQPTQIALGTTQGATDKLKLNFAYNTTGNNDNNGNVVSQTITVPTIGTTASYTATQIYTYDSLNRLKSATETIPSQTGWKQTFVYDRFGNRNFDEGGTSGNYLTTGLTRGCATPTSNPNGICGKKEANPEIETSTNRIKEDQDGDSIKDYEYDASGNTKKNAGGLTFTYDGENKQTEVKNASSVSIGKYSYDGDGKRVKKETLTETTIFVYNAARQLVAEYSTQTATTTQVSYLTSDHLGSPRINTDANGAIISRHDYQPFGEEIQRANYGSDDVRKQFTGYERDDETDLDFGQARMYANRLGRFTTSDPLLASGNIINPKTWNRYSYSLNNPLRFIDPTGLVTCCTEEQITQIIRESYGGEWTTDNKEKVIISEESMQKIIKTALPEYMKQAALSYQAQWNINDQINNNGVSAQTTTSTSKTNPPVTLDVGVEVGGSAEKKPGQAVGGSAQLKGKGDVKGITLIPGTITTTAEGPGNPAAQKAAAMNNIASGGAELAKKLDGTSITASSVTPVIGPPNNSPDYNLTIRNTAPTNEGGLRKVHNLAVEEANQRNPVRIQ